MNLIGLLITFIGIATLGAFQVGMLFSRMQRSVVVGALVGAAAGAAGGAIALSSIRFCSFEADQKITDMIVGGAIATSGAVVAAWLAGWVAEVVSGKRTLTEGQTTSGIFKANWIVPYLLLSPTLLILAVFLYYPAFNTFRLSTLLTRLGTPRTAFRCVSNFSSLIDTAWVPSPWVIGFIIAAIGVGVLTVVIQDHYDPRRKFAQNILPYLVGTAVVLLFIEIFEEDYQQIVANTFIVSLLIVVIGLIISLGIAYLAYQPIRGASVYRTLLIWPYAVSPPVAGIIFSIIFHPTVGVVNHVIESLGGNGLNWFTNSYLAIGTVVLTSVWKTLGYNILFYIAGLQNVSKNLIEAAAIDGANGWQQFYNVILPSLSPITFFLIITNITYAFFDIFGTIDFLTKGGPAGGTTVMIYEIYKLGIEEGDLGRAAAHSVVLFLLVIALTVFQFRTTGERVTYGA